MKRWSSTVLHFWFAAGFSLATFYSATVPAADLDIAQKPLFLANQVEPIVMVMLDNSGSMKDPMYEGSGLTLANFDPAKSYYGIFDSSKNYQYDPSIPVDTSAYGVPISANVSGAFVESSCTPSASDTTCWSGNFLNWLTTRRIDASRMVLVGGKVENRAGFDYLGNGSLQYKILGNNERSDRTITGSYANSSQYSPIPDGATITLDSPADSGAIRSSYDPYAKILVRGGLSGFLYDSSNSVIGEYGEAMVKTTVDAAKNIKSSSWTHVTFQHSYSTTPVVVAGAPSYNGGDPGTVRIKNVDATGFDIVFQEWPYKDGNHTTETIPYLVVEPGSHTLAGGLKIVADTKNTNKTYYTRCGGGSAGSFASVTFPSTFSATPVIIATVITYNETDTIAVRVKDVTASGFQLALEEQEDGDSHATETVAYVAIQQGQFNDASRPIHLDAGRVYNVSSANKTFSFNIGAGFSGTPALLATLNSVNGPDTAVLRTKSVNSTGATLFVEEEQSCESERNHTNETVGYLALSGTSSAYNIAVVVPTLKEGILQQVKDKVRLGVSFYRYDPNRSDIYNGNKIQGGTLKFKIPKNPFVKKPTDPALPADQQGYRELSGYIGTPIEQIVDAIEHYPLVWGTTPIAENLWEVIQYFEQDAPYYPAVVSGFEDFDLADTSHPERDPYYHPVHGKIMECTSANVLIFTDGFPYKDADIPAALVDYDGDGKTASNCTSSSNKDKDCASMDLDAWGHNNLDDVAYWAYCNTSQGSCIDAATGKAGNPSRDLRSDISGDQYLRIDTVGFAGGTIRPILQDTADNAGGTAYAAEDGLALAQALQSVFSKVVGGSAAAVAVNSTSLQSNSKLYLARFDSSDWSGNLLAFKIEADGSLAYTTDANGLMIPDANGWQASIPSTRVIVSYNGISGTPFRWSNLSIDQKNLLDPSNASNSTSPVLDYLRGDQSQESKNGGTFRNRSGLLGDIVHSAPVYVGPPSFPYPDDMEGTAYPYSSFRTSHASRNPMIYVGANDGMLHAFDAATGEEKFAYVPKVVYNRLQALTDPNYVHQYTVDAPPTVVDAFYGSAWHTVLVAGLRGGGQGIYALDVTDPAAWDTESNGATHVLWEFTDNNDTDLGYTFSRPNVVRLYNGDWAAVFGNGYDNTEADSHASTSGNAVLYVVRLSDGALIRKIDTGVGTSDSASGGKPNGLATVAPVDVDGDAVADYVYGGDLYGNLWKFDLTDSDPGQWDVAYKSGSQAQPLFTACSTAPCTDSNRQPITARPRVARHPSGSGYLVFFGTGKYFENGDNSSLAQLTQSLYAIWDKDESSLTSFDRNDLQPRKILAEVSDFGLNLRLTSGINDDAADGGGEIDWNTQLGWYLDLINTQGGNTDNQGERVVTEPILRGNRVIFTTLVPSEDPCSAGGSGWIMELDAVQGTRLPSSPFDLNGNGGFGNDDLVQAIWDVNGDGTVDADDAVPVSGIQSTVGIPSSPGIVSMDDNKEKKYISGSSGNVQPLTEKAGSAKTGRLSWRQIITE
ncbi:type IV pilus assembly protein PilY1 [Methylomarinovum tepidoasis]|uniref:Type IV pilus assembly protein PilY1 n=1 Tax=Methylomarinovum tepidoasis TaxID=2840183 RepID=A0AAU9CEA3_9GAMM|nr:PilC/PilY family type IV pilus protein [Methylomarinovum sp. IN45]BCX88538.1 type IV pilus assembly protein PilY1 [Methylomarinovum sp. IN45]